MLFLGEYFYIYNLFYVKLNKLYIKRELKLIIKKL